MFAATIILALSALGWLLLALTPRQSTLEFHWGPLDGACEFFPERPRNGQRVLRWWRGQTAEYEFFEWQGRFEFRRFVSEGAEVRQ